MGRSLLPPTGRRRPWRLTRPRLGWCSTLLVAAGPLLALPAVLPSRAFACGGRRAAPGAAEGARRRTGRALGPQLASLRAASEAAEAVGSFKEQKEALKRCLAREYRSFFRPFEADFYSEDVTFKDPLNDLQGKQKYRQNVEMLSGDSPVGNILFRDGWIDLHAVEDVPSDERKLRTRWTLGFTFQLLPWQPQALFTGVSEYVIDADAKVLSQRDYWDTLSLGEGGEYVAEAGAAGVAELGAQLLPSFMQPAVEPEAASGGDWALLRRAEAYRIYRTSREGLTFAIGAPGAPADRASLASALRGHGLVPGQALEVGLEGRGRVARAADGAEDALSAAGAVPGVELLPPHPWEGPAPEG